MFSALNLQNRVIPNSVVQDLSRSKKRAGEIFPLIDLQPKKKDFNNSVILSRDKILARSGIHAHAGRNWT